MRVLLVWNEIPEIVKFYILEPTEAELSTLRAAQGGYINGSNTRPDQEGALDCINAALVDPKYGDNGAEGAAKAWLHRWVGHRITERELPNFGPFDQVFSCGFIL